jgi:hypothetical protein
MVKPPRNSQSGKVAAPRGRPFARGNPGRKPGSKNRNTLLAEKLAAHQEKLLDAAIEVAFDGDGPMLMFLLKRVLPRERPINIELPAVEFADDEVAAIAKVVHETAEGKITPAEGAAMVASLSSLAKSIELADITKRLDKLEAMVVAKHKVEKPT